MATCAYNVGKTKLGAVSAVDPLKCFEFGIRQPIESSAVLFSAGLRGEAGGSLRLVSEIWMAPDEGKPKVRCCLVDDSLHRVEQLLHALKRPCDSSVFGDPGRILEDIAESRDELVPAASIQNGEKY